MTTLLGRFLILSQPLQFIVHPLNTLFKVLHVFPMKSQVGHVRFIEAARKKGET
jgi:hypothetical protein